LIKIPVQGFPNKGLNIPANILTSNPWLNDTTWPNNLAGIDLADLIFQLRLSILWPVIQGLKQTAARDSYRGPYEDCSGQATLQRIHFSSSQIEQTADLCLAWPHHTATNLEDLVPQLRTGFQSRSSLFEHPFQLWLGY
jgi:hypothetical protein